jgi:addiction module HigA family antidote
MSRMFNPPHPGEVLKDGVMVEGVTVTGLAKQLGVTRVALSRVLNAHAGISADMALKLARVFGGSAESWLYMQANYDLWQAERRVVKHNKRVHVAA